MKRSLLLIGVMLALLMVGNGCRRDRDRKEKFEKKMELKHMKGRFHGRMGQHMDRAPMRGMRGRMGMGEGRMGQMGPMMGRPPMYGMRGGMGPMGINRPGFGPMAPGRFLERLPNITDKQKKEIADLRQKQMDEMKIFREETAAKMKSMGEDNKAKMMNLLTAEQKKFIESRAGFTPTPPPVSERNK